MEDLISRQAAIDAMNSLQKFSLMDSNEYLHGVGVRLKFAVQKLEQLPSAQSEDYTELKREFLRMASYIDVLLECSDEQKETLVGFISRLAEFMPWTERD